MNDHTSQHWFSAAEYADLHLPGLPTSKRKMNELIKRERWATRVDRLGHSLVRKRQGRGGGYEYSTGLLSPVAVYELERRFGAKPNQSYGVERSASEVALWNWFFQQPKAVKDEAQRRLKIVSDVYSYCQNGATKTASVATLAGLNNLHSSTIWNWLRSIRGISEGDWLPHLASRKVLSKEEIREVPDLATLHHELVNVSHQLAILSVQVATLDKRLAKNETEH